MLIVLLVISILILVIGVIKLCKYSEDAIGIAFVVIGVVLSIVLLMVTPIAITKTVKISQMDNRIAIYEEENTRIEEQIKTTIQVYQDYEKDIFDDIDLDKISSEKLILLTSIYPELKSDTMVQELIKVYIDNNNKLKEIKTSKLDYEIWRWWLCFA
jgi:hypothetical protein